MLQIFPRITTWMLCVALMFALPVAASAFPVSLTEAMHQELARNLDGLRMDGYPAPYFLAYQLKELTHVGMSSRSGALAQSTRSKQRMLRVEVRVGSYDLDNSEDTEGQSYDELLSYQPPDYAPLDDDPRALRHALWLLSDRKYKEALAAYHRVKGKHVYTLENDEDRGKGSFTREAPVVHRDPPAPMTLDESWWAAELRRASARLASHAHLFDSTVELDARKEDRLTINSEGTEVYSEQVIYGIHIRAHTRAEDGMFLEHSADVYGRTPDALLQGPTLDAAVDKVAADLAALRDAPVLEPYTGPAILEPQAAGVIFHEAVGHRLEADRQGANEDGRTFSGQVGKGVLPDLVSVFDDPTQKSASGIELNGYYRHDDEGVVAQRTPLIEGGVLSGFLMRRKPVDRFTNSNGHGRAQGQHTPVARMANLIVQANKTVSRKALQKMLIDEAKRQGKPFGLVIGDITGGSTNTSSYGYQAFKGAARMVYRVDAKTGETTLVRGVEVVGTPLASINKIAAAADEFGVFNGYCGAESGYVPVSTVAPAMLFREVELQRTAKSSQRPPLLPSPLSPSLLMRPGAEGIR